MYYCRPIGSKYSQNFYKTARIKRRRPYDAKYFGCIEPDKRNGQTIESQLDTDIDIGLEQIDGVAIKKENVDDDYTGTLTDKNDQITADDNDDCKTENKIFMQNDDKLDLSNNAKPASEHVFTRKYCNKKPLNRQKLTIVLQKLMDRIPESIVLLSVSGSQGVVNHMTTNNPRIEMLHHQQQHVSPRKRILREFEKVSLDDLTTMKRSRAKGSNNNHHSSSSINSTGVTTAPAIHAVVATTATIGGSNTTSPPINYPFVSQSSKATNGNHNESSILAPPVATQVTSRPISSYSITSLLSHNNSNNKLSDTHRGDVIMNEIPASNSRPPILASPKSPQPPIHPTSHHRSTSAFNSKKKSPSYSGGSTSVGNASCLSPSISQPSASNIHSHYNRTPSLHSPINYGRNRSPDLSPSPEQIYTRYRQTHSGMSSFNSSPSSSSGFHPYLSSASSSRGSPSGALSPPSESSLRYRSLLPPGSPSQQPYSIPSAQSSSPSSFSRYSPSGYSQVSPQHYSSTKGNTSSVSSSNFNMNSLMSNTNNNTNNIKSSRDVSPGTRNMTESLRDNMVGSRTLPKKTAALRQQQYDAPVSSSQNHLATSVVDSTVRHSNIDTFYKSATPTTIASDQCRKINDGTSMSLNLSRPRSPPELNNISNNSNCCPSNSVKYEKDYHRLIANSGSNSTNNPLMAGFDTIEVTSNVIRPSLIPSLQHSHPSMYYMYAPHTVAPSGPYLPPVYYHSMGYASAAAAAAYRNPLWMHYPASAAAATVQPSRLLAYGAAAAAAAASLVPPSSVTTAHSPWGTMPPPHHALITDDPISLVRIKDEPSSGKYIFAQF